MSESTLIQIPHCWNITAQLYQLNIISTKLPKKIRRQVKIPDTEILKKARMRSVHTLLKLTQLRWTGHVTRMPMSDVKRKFSMETLKKEVVLKVAKHNATKTLKKSLKDFNIPTESWDHAAQD